MFKVKVPASTANLGSGFDCIGLALQLYNTFTFKESNSFSLHGFEETFNNEDNLVLVAYQKTCVIKQKEATPVAITIQQDIPLCGGLGSSATCIIAGVMAAFHYIKAPMILSDVLEVATVIEGHPDNVAPALFGSLVSSFYGETKIQTIQYQPHCDYKLYLFIPDAQVDTKLARLILPKTVALKDAVFNISRAVNLAHAFVSGNADLLYEVMQDRIHQDYRMTLIPQASKLFSYCYEQKIPCVISGSGASLLVISKANPAITIDGFTVMEVGISEEGTTYYEE